METRPSRYHSSRAFDVDNIDPYFLTEGDGHSLPAVFDAGGVVTQARDVAGGGTWTYKFNVERCSSLSLSFT